MNQFFDAYNIKNMVTNRGTTLDYWLMKKIILSIFLAAVTMKGMAQEPVNDAFKQIRYADKAFNYTNQVTFTKEGDGQLTLFVNMFPVPRTNEYQIISNLSYSDGQVIVENKYGNHVLCVDFKDFPGQHVGRFLSGGLRVDSL